MSSNDYVLPGACISSISGAIASQPAWQCAYEKTSCGPNMDFISHYQLETNRNSEYDEIIKVCADSDPNSSFSPKIGFCKREIDNGLCTGDYTSCQGCFEKTDACWEDQYDGCTVQLTNITTSSKSDTDIIYPYALFGVCTPSGENENDGVCLWSRTECPGSYNTHTTFETWSSPYLEKQVLCTCNNVQVGACFYEDITKNGGLYSCAVSADGCDDDSSYIPAKNLMELRIAAIDANDGISIPDCTLCSKDFKIPEKESALPEPSALQNNTNAHQITPMEGKNPTLMPTVSPTVQLSSDTSAPSIVKLEHLATGTSSTSPASHGHDHEQGPPPKQDNKQDENHQSEPTKPPYFSAGSITSCPDIPSDGCSVCGDINKCITKPDAIFTFPGQPSVPCWELQIAGMNGLIPLSSCPLLPMSTNINDVCGCDTPTPATPTDEAKGGADDNVLLPSDEEEPFNTGLPGPDIEITGTMNSIAPITMAPIRMTASPTMFPVRLTSRPTFLTPSPSIRPHIAYLPRDDDDSYLQSSTSQGIDKTQNPIVAENDSDVKQYIYIAGSILILTVLTIIIRWKRRQNYYRQDDRDYRSNGYKMNKNSTPLSTFEMVPMHDLT